MACLGSTLHVVFLFSNWPNLVLRQFFGSVCKTSTDGKSTVSPWGLGSTLLLETYVEHRDSSLKRK